MSNNANDRRYWLRAGTLTLLEKGSGLVLALGTAMLLLRGLSKPVFATWALFVLITYFLEMGRSGLLQNGLMRQLALHRGQAKEEAGFVQAAWLINLLYSLAGMVLLWLLAPWLIQQYQAPGLAGILPVYSAIILLMAVMGQANYLQQAHFEFRGIFWSNLLLRGAVFIWALVSKITGRPLQLEELAMAMGFGAATGAVASWLFAQRFLPRQPWRLSYILPSAGKLLAYGKFVLGTNLSTMFYKNVDKLTLGQLLGPAAFAVYDAAGKVTQLVEAPSFSIAAVVFPQSAARMISDGPAAVQRLYERSVGAILCMVLPFVVAVILFAGPIIRILAGDAYSDAADVLRLTALFGLFLPFAVQFGTVLDSTGRPGVNFMGTLATAVVNLTLSYLMVQRFGIMGAALATLTGYALAMVWMQWYLNRHYGVKGWRAFVHMIDFYRIGWRMAKQFLTKNETKIHAGP